MSYKKNGTSAHKNAGPGGLLGGNTDRDYVARPDENLNLKAALSAASEGRVRILQAEFSRFVDGNPKVAIQPLNGRFFVGLTAMPWGWQNRAKTCEFFNPSSACRYASQLLSMIRAEGAAEQARKDRKLELRIRERELGR